MSSHNTIDPDGFVLGCTVSAIDQFGLQLFDGFVQLLPKRHPIKLVEDGLVKPFADSVDLRALRLGAGMIDILHGLVQLVLLTLLISTILGSPVGQHAQ